MLSFNTLYLLHSLEPSRSFTPKESPEEVPIIAVLAEEIHTPPQLVRIEMSTVCATLILALTQGRSKKGMFLALDRLVYMDLNSAWPDRGQLHSVVVPVFSDRIAGGSFFLA
jgi:hypothetical protein